MIRILIDYYASRKRKKMERKKEREAAMVYEEVLEAVSNMYPIPFKSFVFSDYVRKANTEEVTELIERARTIIPSMPTPGYYIPAFKNYIEHSLKTWPDRVFYFMHLNIHVDFFIDLNSSFVKTLPKQYMNSNLFVFYYDDFGFEETHLCARRGYVLYDSEKKDIVAHAWTAIS